MDRGIALGRPPAPCQEAGATFQRLIDKIMEGLDFVFVYLDDILISSVDEDEHCKQPEVGLPPAPACWPHHQHGEVKVLQGEL